MGAQNSMLHVRIDSELKRKATEALGELACISHHPTVEARDKKAVIRDS